MILNVLVPTSYQRNVLISKGSLRHGHPSECEEDGRNKLARPLFRKGPKLFILTKDCHSTAKLNTLNHLSMVFPCVSIFSRSFPMAIGPSVGLQRKHMDVHQPTGHPGHGKGELPRPPRTRRKGEKKVVSDVLILCLWRLDIPNIVRSYLNIYSTLKMKLEGTGSSCSLKVRELVTGGKCSGSCRKASAAESTSVLFRSF